MEARNQDYLQRHCPACETVQTQLHIASEPKAEHLPLTDIEQYWAGFFKEKVFFSYHRCLDCGLLYCPLFFTQQQLNQFYKSMSDNTAGVPLSALRKTQKSYFDVVKKYSSLQGGFLEFGPDIGLFTEHCLQLGAFDDYWLFEPNREVWSTLEKKMGQKRHTIFSDVTDLEKIPDSSISTCVMIHVLDHLLEPDAVLQTIKKKLMPGAILAFVTHNEQSLLAKAIKKKWLPFCLQHPQLFNPASIHSLLKKAGLKVIDCKKSYNYFPLTYLIKHFLWLFGMRRITLPAWENLQLGLKLGNIITLAKFEA